ncbi:heavy-metal-associated domain-containing protein [Peptoniphilus catoniae]|uniref:heavy-metal-associated domain-containing protein n=1 Tax=Peptoniphilus catoniae TaxID=1660341 RepID=UPI0010FE0C8E|nr:heavy-metal-associated domain-containing protein [Peptoniphilus catoniae]
MDKTINIEGMTCEHCAAHVKEALEALSGVESVKVSLFKNSAKVNGDNLNDEQLKKAIEEAGYKAKSIK